MLLWLQVYEHGYLEVHGGVTSRVTIVVSPIIRGLITLLITTHEPLSRATDLGAGGFIEHPFLLTCWKHLTAKAATCLNRRRWCTARLCIALSPQPYASSFSTLCHATSLP